MHVFPINKSCFVGIPIASPEEFLGRNSPIDAGAIIPTDQDTPDDFFGTGSLALKVVLADS
jgi:hypothetical protein